MRLALFAFSALVGCKDTSRAETKARLEAKLAGAKPGEEREIEPGTFMTMFRMQATSPTTGGWQHADSTEGGFSVDLPLPFNDFRMRSMATDNVEIRTDIVGAKSPGLLSWAATCVRRKDGKVTAEPAGDLTEQLGTPVRAWKRSVIAEARDCFAIVEAQGTDPLPPAAEIERFLQSFKLTAPTAW